MLGEGRAGYAQTFGSIRLEGDETCIRIYT
jgi:hypothetical protein